MVERGLVEEALAEKVVDWLLSFLQQARSSCCRGGCYGSKLPLITFPATLLRQLAPIARVAASLDQDFNSSSSSWCALSVCIAASAHSGGTRTFNEGVPGLGFTSIPYLSVLHMGYLFIHVRS